MHFTEYDIECIQQAKDFISVDLAKHYTIPEISLQVGISRTKLKAGFKEVFGMGIYEYQHEQKLLKAKYLIENTNKTLKEISHSTEYKYVNNFGVAFKKRFGKTASKWKNDAG